MADQEYKQLSREELNKLAGEELPERAAMSLLYPPSPTGPIPLGADGIATIGPEPIPGESVPPESA